MTYYERVAKKMCQTAVDTSYSYQNTLDALHQRFPHEDDLRVMIGMLEKIFQMAMPDFQFVPYDGEHHGSQRPS